MIFLKQVIIFGGKKDIIENFEAYITTQQGTYSFSNLHPLQ